MYQILENHLDRIVNPYIIIGDDTNTSNNKYVVMHVIKGKYGIYEYKYHHILSQFEWTSNNGNIIGKVDHSSLSTEHKEILAPYLHKLYVPMDRLILECFESVKCPQTNFDTTKKTKIYLIEHINGKTRDNRLANLRWITKRHYDDVRHPKFYRKKVPKQLKDLGIREYPKYVKWLESHNAFVIDDHPLTLYDHELDRRNKIRIFSNKAKTVTPFDKLMEIQHKLDILEDRPYLTFQSFKDFKQKQQVLMKEHDEMLQTLPNHLVFKAEKETQTDNSTQD